ncbi:VOC family protein [Aphanizomenon sp. CS-733/32]|uniref:VOC family protein n=1 Tax=Aphanizomenon sp. CS-733/32 TaxID=3021715 RepID=UPI00232EF96E|nr:VOC family protein [Aphanizomenon sp. CS-733/32]MDB9311335.1 VOC family protein [Aphanizomenon sp. CS-733/32]
MAIDHLSFATRDMDATRHFYETQLGFNIVIHEHMIVEEGGYVDHVFFDCGDGCCLAFMHWVDAPMIPSSFDTGINLGLGVPPGTYHFALRCNSLTNLEARRSELIYKGVTVGEILDLHPYKSFFFDDPNGLRLEYTTLVASCTEIDKDPTKRRFPISLEQFKKASQPAN